MPSLDRSPRIIGAVFGLLLSAPASAFVWTSTKKCNGRTALSQLKAFSGHRNVVSNKSPISHEYTRPNSHGVAQGSDGALNSPFAAHSNVFNYEQYSTTSTVGRNSHFHTNFVLHSYRGPNGPGGGGNDLGGRVLSFILNNISIFGSLFLVWLVVSGKIFLIFELFLLFKFVGFLLPVLLLGGINLFIAFNSVKGPCPNCGLPQQLLKFQSSDSCTNCGIPLTVSEDGKKIELDRGMRDPYEVLRNMADQDSTSSGSSPFGGGSPFGGDGSPLGGGSSSRRATGGRSDDGVIDVEATVIDDDDEPKKK